MQDRENLTDELIKHKVRTTYKDLINILPSGLSPFYSDEDKELIPKEIQRPAGCGNPLQYANNIELRGKIIVDMGSGFGIDAFLVAKKMEGTGLVIGIDITPEMIKKASLIANSLEMKNLTFVCADIEHLPIRDSVADLVLSNCAMHLCPNLYRAFSEVHRTMRNGGIALISDITSEENVDDGTREHFKRFWGCYCGIPRKSQLLEVLKEIGFSEMRILDSYEICSWDFLTVYEVTAVIIKLQK
jgi:ubiquinone/menaquinone biosynthesis C-methylase UbiE